MMLLDLPHTFCVCRWNAEGLGIGSTYMHTTALVILWLTPLCVCVCVCGVMMLLIDGAVVGDVVRFAGVLLCLVASSTTYFF
jgi:hypothetical protein